MRVRIAIPPKSQGKTRSTHTAVPKSPQVSFQSPQNKTKGSKHHLSAPIALAADARAWANQTSRSYSPVSLLLLTSTSRSPHFIFNYSATTPTQSAAPLDTKHVFSF